MLLRFSKMPFLKKDKGKTPESFPFILIDLVLIFELIKAAQRVAFVFENVEHRQEFGDREQILNFLRQVQ